MGFVAKIKKAMLEEEHRQRFDSMAFTSALEWLVSDFSKGRDITLALDAIGAAWPHSDALNAYYYSDGASEFVVWRNAAKKVQIIEISC